MSAVDVTIHIDAPAEAVWEVVTDADRLEEWVTIHRGLKRSDPGDLEKGYAMEQVLCLRGVKFDVKWKAAEVEHERLLRWEGRGPARSRATTEYRLSERDGATRFEYHNEFKAPLGPLGAVASKALVGGVPEREANASLERLKALVESA
jgi:uncharacterized protein YndB with AHSA1/START domain